MYELFVKMEEALIFVDRLIEDLENYKIESELKNDLLQNLENCWLEIFIDYEKVGDALENTFENFNWN